MAPTFRIPTENEWYKAAYYSPNYGGSGVGGTFDQSGNVYQWNDLDGTAGSFRGLRGGGVDEVALAVTEDGGVVGGSGALLRDRVIVVPVG